jgi:hypothetical protein
MAQVSDPLLADQRVSPVELVSGIDALYLSGRGELPGDLLATLDAVRSVAAEQGSPVTHSLGGYPVEVLGHGWGKYRYCARHELARFGFTSSESLPAVRVQPTSLAIHALGPETTVLWVRNVLDAAGLDVRLQVSRLDLHSDWQGLWVEAEERQNFVGYANRRALYEVDETLSGLNIGSRGGALYARIYDKTREVEQTGHDWWIELWGERFDPERPVLRVEFEFSRDGLREFAIDTPEDAFEQLGPLWAYATGSWLSLRTPGLDETRARWSVDARWQAVQRSALAGGALPAERIRAGEKAGSLRKLMPQLVGYLTSAAVHLGTADLFDTFDALGPHVDVFERQTGVTFGDRVDEKRSKP